MFIIMHVKIRCLTSRSEQALSRKIRCQRKVDLKYDQFSLSETKVEERIKRSVLSLTERAVIIHPTFCGKNGKSQLSTFQHSESNFIYFNQIPFATKVDYLAAISRPLEGEQKHVLNLKQSKPNMASFQATLKQRSGVFGGGVRGEQSLKSCKQKASETFRMMGYWIKMDRYQCSWWKISFSIFSIYFMIFHAHCCSRNLGGIRYQKAHEQSKWDDVQG